MNHADALAGIYNDLVAVGLVLPQTAATVKLFDLPRGKDFTLENIAEALADGTVKWSSPLVRLIVEDRVGDILRHVTEG